MPRQRNGRIQSQTVGAKVAVTDLNLRAYGEFEAETKDMTANSAVDEIDKRQAPSIRLLVSEKVGWLRPAFPPESRAVSRAACC
jgi:hypothetical protein